MKTKMHSETILYHDDTGKYPNPKKSQDQIIKTKILSGHCLFFFNGIKYHNWLLLKN